MNSIEIHEDNLISIIDMYINDGLLKKVELKITDNLVILNDLEGWYYPIGSNGSSMIALIKYFEGNHKMVRDELMNNKLTYVPKVPPCSPMYHH